MSLTYLEAFNQLVAPSYHVWGNVLKEELRPAAQTLNMEPALNAANPISFVGDCYNAWNSIEGTVGPIPYSNARSALRESDIHPVIRHKIQGVAPKDFTGPVTLPGVEPKKINMLVLVNHIEGGAGAIGNRIFSRRGLIFIQVGISDDRDKDERYLLGRLYSITQPLTELYQSVVEYNGVWITDVISREQTVGGGTFHTVQARFQYDQVFDEPQIASLIIPSGDMDMVRTDAEIEAIATRIAQNEIATFMESLQMFAFKTGPKVPENDIDAKITRDSELLTVHADGPSADTVGRLALESSGLGAFLTRAIPHHGTSPSFQPRDYVHANFLGVFAATPDPSTRIPGNWFVNRYTFQPVRLILHNGVNTWIDSSYAYHGLVYIGAFSGDVQAIPHATDNDQVYVNATSEKLRQVTNFRAGTNPQPDTYDARHLATDEDIRDLDGRVRMNTERNVAQDTEIGTLGTAVGDVRSSAAANARGLVTLNARVDGIVSASGWDSISVSPRGISGNDFPQLLEISFFNKKISMDVKSVALVVAGQTASLAADTPVSVINGTLGTGVLRFTYAENVADTIGGNISNDEESMLLELTVTYNDDSTERIGIPFLVQSSTIVDGITIAQATAIANARAAAVAGPVIVISNIASFDAAQNRFEDSGGNEVVVPNGSIVVLTQAVYDAAVADAQFTPNVNAIFLTR